LSKVLWANESIKKTISKWKGEGQLFFSIEWHQTNVERIMKIGNHDLPVDNAKVSDWIGDEKYLHSLQCFS
jgi:hypothetical protein